jgi:hypothetical protein
MSKLFPLPYTDPTIKNEFIYFEFNIRLCKEGKEDKKKMPLKLSTTIGKIQCITDTKNIEIIMNFLIILKIRMFPPNIIKIII